MLQYEGCREGEVSGWISEAGFVMEGQPRGLEDKIEDTGVQWGAVLAQIGGMKIFNPS